MLASDAVSTHNYIIEIAGYVSSAGTRPRIRSSVTNMPPRSHSTCGTRPTAA
jgi:hypothetical protein